MNRREREILNDLRYAARVPGPAVGTQSSTTQSFVGYALDIATATRATDAILLGLVAGEEWEGWVCAPPAIILRALQAWNESRRRADWSFAGAAELTPLMLVQRHATPEDRAKAEC